MVKRYKFASAWNGGDQFIADESYVLASDYDAADHEFKNFHRVLCERFGYAHDPVDWKRDQLSLIEHIATQASGVSEHG